MATQKAENPVLRESRRDDFDYTAAFPDVEISLSKFDASRLGQSKRSFGDRVRRRLIAWMLRYCLRCNRIGCPERGLKILKNLTTFAPDICGPQIFLARLAFSLGDTGLAKLALDAAVHSGCPFSCRRLTRAVKIYMQLGFLRDAERLLAAALKLYPESHSLWFLRGQLFRQKEASKSAINCFQQSLQLAKTNRERILSLGGIANCFADSGDKEAAGSIYQTVLEHDPHDTRAYSALVECQEIPSPSAEMPRMMKGLLASSSVDIKNKQHLHYALGRLHDRHGEYAEAFAHFKSGNEIRARTVSTNVDEMRFIVEARMRYFSRQVFEHLAPYGCQDELLICIVGMPRSGTSLMEQILSTQPGVSGLGERLDFWRASRNIYCQRQTMSPQLVGTLSQNIRAQLRASVECGTRIVTKRPEDFWDLGLISVLFPRVKILHCQRNPIDTCLSCHMQNFEDVPYATDLFQLADVYRLYGRIMRHWKAVLPESMLLDVQYETLVQEPDRVIKEISEFCDLSLEENWSEFHSVTRRVDTASVWQVRQPLYHSSVAKWTHYAPFLGPLLTLTNGAGQTT